MARDATTPRQPANGARRVALLGFAAALLIGAMPPSPAPAMLVDPVAHSARACTMTGDGGADRLGGTGGHDVICGRGGADRIRGNGGHDILLGGRGGDLVQGKAGRDRLDGGPGNDRAFGGSGADDVRGGAGNDALGGGLGPDRLSGGSGRDIVYYGQRRAAVTVTIGNRANDGVAGERDNVKADVEDVQGGRGNDVLTGSGRSNRLFGGAGKDRLRGKGGSDVLVGGDGDDRLDARERAPASGRAAQAGAVDRVSCGGGNDTAFVDPVDVVDPGCENVIGAAAVNHAPTGIALSKASVAENSPGQTTVGTLSASDPDPGDRHTFALVPGAGSTDNASFEIAGDQLRTSATTELDYETKSSYSIRVRATDFGTPAGQIVRAFTITVTDVNERPTITTSAGALTYVEDGAPTTVDGALTVTDTDDANLEGATVRVSVRFQAGDDLLFTDQNGITGAFNGLTGVLTLSGTSSLANYQTALRSVQYRHNGDNPAGSKMVEFRADDGGGLGSAASRATIVTPVNDPPAIDTSTGSASFTEGADPVPVDTGLSVTDPDSAMLTGATVTLGAPLAEDSLRFTSQSGITGTYDAGTGVLTLSGTTTVANYQAALRSVTYANSSSDPSTTPRTVEFQVTDAGGLPSNVDTRTVTVAAANDAPTVLTSGGTLDYTEGAAATAVDPGVVVADLDDPNLVGATVRVSAGFQAGDELLFTNQSGINGAYDVGTGVLTLTGNSSVASYQTALRSVLYRTTNNNPATAKTIEFVVNDGTDNSAPATRVIAVHGVNDPPTLSTTNAPLAYPEGAGPVAADPGITLSEPDSTQIQGATVQITSNFVAAQDELAFADQLGITGSYDDATGTLTLTGTTSVTNYRAALRAVTFENSSDNPSPSSRTLTFWATDADGATSAPATRDITFGAANDAATITTTGTPLAYTEGAAATAVDPGLTVNDPDDTDLEGATVRISTGFNTGDELLFTNQNGITGSYNAGSGVLTLAGTSSLANYQTALRSLRFRTTNDNPASIKTVEFRADDGDGFGPASTRNIDVTPVDDPPVAVDDTGTVAEDSGANAIDVLANDTDPDGGLMTIASASDPANGTVVLTGGLPGAHTGLTYQPDPDYCNDPPGTTPNTFTYTLTGGSTATVSVTVTCVDDPPTAVNDTATVAEDSGASAVAVLANDTDSDGGPKTIGSASDPANGTVVVTGGGTGLTYQPDANYCNTQPGGTPDTFTYTLNGGSTATVSVIVTCADDPPTAVDDTATVAEDSGASAVDVQTNDTDPDAGPKTIASASDPANGTVVLTGGSPGAHTGLTYRPDPNYCNDPPGTSPDTFTYTLTGGSTATVSVKVTCAPDNPVVETSAGSTSYTENAAATVIDPAVTVSDVDAGTITGATVQITGGYAGVEDILALAGTHPGITATLSGDTLTFTGPATVAAYQAALRDVTYRNGSENPSTAARTVTFTLTDATNLSGSDTKGITVTAVDDPPTAVNDSATVLEDAAASAITVLTNDTDVDAGPKTIASASDPANGTVVLTGGSPGAHTGLSYQPDPNYCNSQAGGSPDTFTYTVNGGSTATVSVTVTCVNDAPTADDETFDGANGAIGNTSLVVNDPSDDAPTLNSPKKSITGDILAGDSDIDGPGPLTVTPGTFATNDGGSVTIEADGDFIYINDPADNCADSSDFFDYTLEDSGTPELTDTGRVTIAVAGCVWYVNNNDPAGNSGTSRAPFDTLTQAETASANNHTVFVFDGDNTSTGYGGNGYTMNSGERLIGEHEGLTVDPDQGGPLAAPTLHPANPGAHPTLTATNADVIDLDDANEIRGVNIDPSGTGGGIAGGTGDVGGTIDDVNINDTTTFGSQPGLELDTTTGTFAVSDFTVITNGATGVRLNNAGTVTFAATGTISIATANAAGLDAGGTALGTSTFDSVTVTGSGNGGVRIANATAASTIAFGDLALTTTSGTTPAFGVSSSGTVTVPAAGTASVSATGGPAVDATGLGAGSGLAFDTITASGNPTKGVNLDGTGNWTFSAGAGSAIGATTQVGFDVNGGSGAVTYPGTIANGTGEAVEITGRTGDTTVSGNITGAGGTGINVTNNTAGTTTFSGTTKTLNTAANTAVTLAGNTGHTINLTGGGLDIDTTTGVGFSATGGGTVTAQGPGNTIDAVSATALNVANTSIGGGNLNFVRVSSGNNTAAADPANGIVLNTTGTAAGNGGLVVSGDGGGSSNGSGGVIQNTTGTGVSLTSTRDVSLGYVNVTNSGDDGIHANATTNFTLNRANVNNNGNSTSDDGIQFGEASGSVVGVLGNLTISNSSVNANAHNGFWVRNTSGTLSSMSVTGSSFNDVNDTTGANAFLFEGSGTSTLTAGTISGSTFRNNTPQRALTVQGHETATVGTMTVSGNTFVDNGVHASFEQDSSANLTFRFINNGSVATPMTGSILQAVNVFSSSQASGGTITGTISGNRIGIPNVERSAGDAGAISGVIQGQTDATLLVDGNIIRGTNGDSRAIGFAFRGAAPPLANTLPANNVVSDLTLTNNDVVPGAAQTGFPLSAIMVEADNQTGADNKAPTIRADIRGNTVPAGASFDLLPTNLAFYEYDAAGAHGIGQLVDTPPASADATAQLTSMNTGSASAFGVALIPGPITTPP